MTVLDAKFGSVIEAQPRSNGTSIDTWERDHTPVSITILSAKTARQLRNFMEDTEAGFAAGRVLAADVIIIWVIDTQGAVRFAVEEMVHDGLPTGIPKLQTFQLTRFLPKLGHPSLLRDEAVFRGRIGGEIRLEVSGSTTY